MANRTGNYCAFYVDTPFSQSNLAAYSTKDFVYYNLLKAWAEKDSNFSFVDSHEKNYNVRDDSNWESTLKPRLHDRLNRSKNIILFLSTLTTNSVALREEIDFGINSKGLPLIVVYPEFIEKTDIKDYSRNTIKSQVTSLWNKVPVLRDSIHKVPSIHLPHDKALIKQTLNDADFMVLTKIKPGTYSY